jgi:hypothetical protein
MHTATRAIPRTTAMQTKAIRWRQVNMYIRYLEAGDLRVNYTFWRSSELDKTTEWA